MVVGYISSIIDKIYDGIASVIIRSPKGVIAGMIVICILALIISAQIPTQSESDEYMDKSSPAGIIYNQYSTLFNQDTYILLIQTDTPTDPTLLNQLLILEEEFKRLPHISETYTLADALAELNGGVIPDNKEEINVLIKQIAPETLSQLMPDPETSLGYILLEQGVSSDTSENVVPIVMQTLKDAELPPGVSIEMSGNTPYDMEIEDSSMESFSILIMGSMVLMLLILGLLFSNMRYWLLPILLLIFGLIYAFGVMGLFGIPANDGATTAFPILLGLGIDYAVQFHARFDEERRKKSSEEALRTTIRNTGPAVFSAMIATSIGFVAMFIVPIPMIQTFGLVAILGVVCCYITTLFGFGAFILTFGYEPKEMSNGITFKLMEKYGHFLSVLAGKITSLSIPVVLISILIAAIGISADPGIVIDTSTRSMVPANLPAQLIFDKVENVVGSMTPFPVYMRGGDLTDLTVISWLDRLDQYLVQTHPEIISVDSISVLVRKYNRGILPLNQEELDHVLSLIPKEESGAYLEGPETGAIVINTQALEINPQRVLKQAVLEDIKWLEPPAEVEFTPTGDFDLYTVLIDQIEDNKTPMTVVAFILIFLFLVVVYRKIVATTPLIPLICIVGWNPVAMILMGENYNVMTAVLGSMTIGIGSEYTILVMERYLEEAAMTEDRLSAIQEAVRKIGSAVSVSGLVTAGGFSALLLSPFPFLSTFGLSTVIAVGFSLIGAIIIMPAALSLMTGSGKRKKKQPPGNPVPAV